MTAVSCIVYKLGVLHSAGKRAGDTADAPSTYCRFTCCCMRASISLPFRACAPTTPHTNAVSLGRRMYSTYTVFVW